MAGAEEVRAWRPDVAGVAEVLHARFTRHAYPVHTHDTWTLMVVHDGAVRYDLDRHPRDTARDLVTLLPPGVPHDGRAMTDAGFRKRVVYLEPHLLDVGRAGAAVDHPGVVDGDLRAQVDLLHRALADPAETFEAEDRLASVTAALDRRLGGPRAGSPTGAALVDTGVAARLRDLLDEHLVTAPRLADAAARLGTSPTHLVRSFSRAYGIAPHRYLTGRRLDRARRLLLAGVPAAEVATLVGFHDQSHLTRHFRRLLGTTPGAYAATA